MSATEDPRKQKLSALRREVFDILLELDDFDSKDKARRDLEQMLAGEKLERPDWQSEEFWAEQYAKAEEIVAKMLELARQEPAIDIVGEQTQVKARIEERLAQASAALNEAVKLSREHGVPFEYDYGYHGEHDPSHGWSQSHC